MTVKDKTKPIQECGSGHPAKYLGPMTIFGQTKHLVKVSSGTFWYVCWLNEDEFQEAFENVPEVASKPEAEQKADDARNPLEEIDWAGEVEIRLRLRVPEERRTRSHDWMPFRCLLYSSEYPGQVVGVAYEDAGIGVYHPDRWEFRNKPKDELNEPDHEALCHYEDVVRAAKKMEADMGISQQKTLWQVWVHHPGRKHPTVAWTGPSRIAAMEFRDRLARWYESAIVPCKVPVMSPAPAPQ